MRECVLVSEHERASDPVMLAAQRMKESLGLVNGVPLLAMILVGIIAWFIACAFIAVFEAAVDTIFLSFLHDSASRPIPAAQASMPATQACMPATLLFLWVLYLPPFYACHPNWIGTFSKLARKPPAPQKHQPLTATSTPHRYIKTRPAYSHPTTRHLKTVPRHRLT